MSAATTSTTSANGSGENFMTGILLAFLAFAGYSIMDVTVKMLVKHYSVPQVIVFNNLFAFGPILTYAIISGGLWRNLRTRRPGMHLARACCGLCSGFLGFYAYSKMPIADVYALAFTAPLFITALAVPVLKEPVGWRRWTAVGVGFLGVMVMLRPGSGLLNPAAFAALGGAFFYSIGMLITRLMRGTESSVSFAFYSSLCGLLVYGSMLPWLGQMPTLPHLGLSALGGTFCGIAFVCLLTAFRKVPAAVAAPFQYTQIIWGVLYGYIFFGDRPDGMLFVGVAIVIASGLYILYRETLLGRQVAAQPVADGA